jgi:hypothetical protein
LLVIVFILHGWIHRGLFLRQNSDHEASPEWRRIAGQSAIPDRCAENRASKRRTTTERS